MHVIMQCTNCPVFKYHLLEGLSILIASPRNFPMCETVKFMDLHLLLKNVVLFCFFEHSLCRSHSSGPMDCLK